MVVFKGFSPNEYFEWEDSHPLCSNALSPSGSVMITITITITIIAWSLHKYLRLLWRQWQRFELEEGVKALQKVSSPQEAIKTICHDGRGVV